MAQRRDYAQMIGLKVGKLTVVAVGDITKRRAQKLVCRCECGTERQTEAYKIATGRVHSCGCVRPGMRKDRPFVGTSEHNSWRAMRNRCNQPSHEHYKYYGGRGIKVCERWDSFENFLADMGERPKGRTLDRVDTNGNYEPGNCRWATPTEQVRNQRPKTPCGAFRKLRENEVREIKILLSHGVSMARLAAKFGVSAKAIYSIKTLKSWRHVS